MVLWAKLNEPNCIVSSDGRVFAVQRHGFIPKSKSVSCNFSLDELPTRLRNGYKLVQILSKTFAVHSLVAKAFLGDKPEGFQIDHINRDRQDNRKENLRYVTPRENSLNTCRSLSRKELIGEYSGKTDYYRKRFAALGVFKTKRNGKNVVLPISERRNGA